MQLGWKVAARSDRDRSDGKAPRQRRRLKSAVRAWASSYGLARGGIGG